MERNTLKSVMILMLAAFIWGMGFVSQRYGMELVGPFFFSGARTALAALTILLIIAITRGKDRRKTTKPAEDRRQIGAEDTRNSYGWNLLMKGGVACGVVLFLGQGLQQVGMVTTSASKSGFLTALYIVLVPIISIFLKKHTHWNTWASVVIAAIGLYFLSITENFTMLPGDLVLLIGAVLWATHILVTGHYVTSLDQQGIYKLVTIQFVTCSALSFIMSPFIDMKLVPIPLTTDIFIQVTPALLYAGCVSAGIGFTLQAIGQKHINPSATGIVLSLEAVFGAIGGALLLSERMSARESLGCAIMFAAVVLSQVPVKGKKSAAPVEKSE